MKKTKFWVWGLIILLYCAGDYRIYQDKKNYPTGDEPHFLILTQSLLYDGDLAVYNNYLRGDWKEYFHHEKLDPHLSPLAKRYSQHFPGYPVLLIIPYFLGGYPGCLLFSSFLMLWILYLTYRIANKLIGNKIPYIFLLLIAISYPCLIYSEQIHPDLIVAIIILLNLELLLFKKSGKSSWFIIAMLIFLPLFHVKYVLINMLMAVFYFFRFKEWTRRYFVSLCSLVGILSVCLYNDLFYNSFGFYGTHGHILSHAQSEVFRSILIHSFDPQYGLFIQTPLLFLIPSGVYSLIRKTGKEGFYMSILLIIPYVILLVFYSYYPLYNIGWSPAGRQFLCVIPLLLIPVFLLFSLKLNRVSNYILGIFSVITIGLGIYHFINLSARYDFVGVISTQLHITPSDIPRFWEYWRSWGYYEIPPPVVHPQAYYWAGLIVLVMILINGYLIRQINISIPKETD